MFSPSPKATISSASCTVLVFVLFLLSGCISSYPLSEHQSGVTYPLPPCDEKTLRLAGMQAANPDERRISKHTLCVTQLMARAPKPAETKSEEKQRAEQEAFSPNEKALRKFVEAPFAKGVRPAFGIALSGGGTKASSFSVGVMAGLADSGLLDRADYLSTVSGGGYAAYYYYAHRLFPLVREGGRDVPTNDDLYRDCVDLAPASLITDKVRAQILQVNHCDRPGLASASTSSPSHHGQIIKYQAFQKCTQDLLRPGDCDANTTKWHESGFSKISLAGTFLSAIPSFVSNTIFDWGYSTSPAAMTYHDGIGLSNGATIKQQESLAKAQDAGMKFCNTGSSRSSEAFDCVDNLIDPDPVPLTFAELKTGLLKMNSKPETRLPFWIINAAAPQYRSSFGWFVKTKEDVTNSDMFEMTAVSHGSGRYGYVPAPVSIYDMSVLHAVAASAAFFDSSQTEIRNPAAKVGVGILQHVSNFNWGYDIPNYNVSTNRRDIHRLLPIGLYYADGYIASRFADNRNLPGAAERNKPAFIRIIDGGNAENLGVYSLVKRDTRNILISDAAQDSDGYFEDICGLKKRLRDSPDGDYPQHLYVPGLAGFDKHCKLKRASPGYSIQHWRSEHPVLLGCVRKTEAADPDSESCQNLDQDETRLFIVKPAIDLEKFSREQSDRSGNTARVSACHTRGMGKNDKNLLNCDSAIFLAANINAEKKFMRASDVCPIFPQHKTTRMTANSSATLFVAYRELARQYIDSSAALLREVVDGSDSGNARFGEIARLQHADPLTHVRKACPALGAGM